MLLHAVSDALLGSAALGDIGCLFPDTDEKYKNADSLKLLSEVVKLLKSKGISIVNIDCTVIAQKPKLREYIDFMRANIAAACDISDEFVSVKATTEEGMGFTGSGDGIAAHAVCLTDN